MARNVGRGEEGKGREGSLLIVGAYEWNKVTETLNGKHRAVEVKSSTNSH